jgi:hypothetical protein
LPSGHRQSVGRKPSVRNHRTDRSASTHASGYEPLARGVTYEVEGAGEIERIVNGVQLVEVQRLGQLDEGQPMPSVIGIQQVAKVIAKLMISTASTAMGR